MKIGFIAGVVVVMAGMGFSVQAIAGNKHVQDGYCQIIKIQRRLF